MPIIDVITSALDAILAWLRDPDIQTKIAGAVLAALVLALLKWVPRRLSHTTRFMLGRLASPPYTAELLRYRQRLDADSLSVRHAWMKEGQTLKDILVPIAVEGTASGESIEDLTVALSKVLSREPPVHAVVIIGGPGAGKSVALRVAARHASAIVHAASGTPLVPVLLTFSSYRHAEFRLVDALVESLQARSFQPAKGPDGGALARQLVTEYLAAGRLLIFVDALDELDIRDRTTALHRLTLELKTHERARVVLSCRTAAWRGQLDGVAYEVLRVAEFSPLAIRQFVHSWGFPAPKSATELLSVIPSQPHIADLARNPLMLTIIAFLYSQPKYRLPDNRAQFFEICSLALLQEWDQAQNPERANRYDRPHKENLLGRLAHEHMCGPNPDEDIEEITALDSLARGMDELGLVRGENARMLDEIVLSSGLLVRLPPTGLRFPHQTFLEYFAALHLLRQASPEALLEQYRADRTRWREVVRLYCGINADMKESAHAVTELLAWDSVEMALAALTDARAVPRPVAEQVLAAAEQKIASQPSAEIINHLGCFSANTQSAYADRAAAYLKDRLDDAVAGRFPGELLESLLLAVLRRPTEATTGFVVEHIEQLDLRRILPAMGERALDIATAVVRVPGLAVEKKIEWVDGLRRAGAVRLLLRLAVVDDVEAQLRKAAAIALVRISQTEHFWQAVDDPETPTPAIDSDAEDVYLRWGWPFDRPVTEAGRRKACYLASVLADAVRDGSPATSPDELELAHGRLLYLAAAVLRERDERRRRLAGARPWPKKLAAMDNASVAILRSIWRKAADARWARWVGALPRVWDGDAIALLGVFPAMWMYFTVGIPLVVHLSSLGDAGVEWRFAALYFGLPIAGAATYMLATIRRNGRWRNFDDFGVLGDALLLPRPPLLAVWVVDDLARTRPRRHLWHAGGACAVVLGFVVIAWYAPGPIWFRLLLFLMPLQLPSIHGRRYLALPPILATWETLVLFTVLRHDSLLPEWWVRRRYPRSGQAP